MVCCACVRNATAGGAVCVCLCLCPIKGFGDSPPDQGERCTAPRGVLTLCSAFFSCSITVEPPGVAQGGINTARSGGSSCSLSFCPQCCRAALAFNFYRDKGSAATFPRRRCSRLGKLVIAFTSQKLQNVCSAGTLSMRLRLLYSSCCVR